MKKLCLILLVVGILLCLTACGESEDTAPQVALTDVAAEAVPADVLAPADLNEVAVATEEIILTQPMEIPMPMPASGEPSADPAADTQAESAAETDAPPA